VKIKWLGHSCFLITSEKNVKIITDPYTSSEALKYREINESADIVLVSHEHFDHSNAAAVKGNPVIIKTTGVTEAKSIKFKGIPVFHDEAGGSKRGKNLIFVFELDGIHLCHLGDLGHKLSNKEITEIGKVDILFMPAGGFYTMECDVADEVVSQISPKVTIPMHFLTPQVNAAKFGAICGIENFLKGKKGIQHTNSSEVEFKAGKLPVSAQITVLKPAL